MSHTGKNGTQPAPYVLFSEEIDNNILCCFHLQLPRSYARYYLARWVQRKFLACYEQNKHVRSQSERGLLCITVYYLQVQAGL